MYVRSPAERYIKYLLLQDEKPTTEQVKEQLLEYNRVFVSDAYIERLRSRLKPPVPFHPHDMRHLPSLRFLQQEKVARLFHREHPMEVAFHILEHPRVQEFVEAMILCRTQYQAISNFVQFQWQVQCSCTGVEYYKDYFWDIDLLDASGVRVMLQLQIDNLAESVPELMDRKGILKAAYYRDARAAAATVPSTTDAALLIQSRMGFHSKRFDMDLATTNLMGMALRKAFEALVMDGPQDHMKFVNYVNGARMLGELRELTRNPGAQLHDELSKLSMKPGLGPVIEMQQLTGGNHTVEIEPRDSHGQPGLTPGTSSETDGGPEQ